MTQQLRKAALCVQLNISEGSSGKSDIERKRFYEVSRGPIVEVDTVFDIAGEPGYFKKEDLSQTGELMIKTFQMLSKMIVY